MSALQERSRLDHWMFGALLLFVSLVLFVPAIHTTYMHEDEELSYRTTTGQTLAHVVQYEATRDVHPPLWYAVFWAWQSLAGDGEFVGRLHAVLLSMVTLALGYRMGCTWYGAPRFGLFTMAALGVNAFFFIYSLDIRPYALTMLTTAFSMWTYQRWLTRPTRRRALLYGMTAALMLYVHYYTVFLLFIQVFAFLLQRPSRNLVSQGLGAGFIALMLWLPWMPVFVGQVLTIRSLTASVGGQGFALGAPTEATPQAIGRLLQVATNGLPWLYAAILLIGLFYLRRSRAFTLALAWALLVPAVILAVNLFTAVYTQRYIAFISVGLALALGASLASLPPRTRWLALAGLVGLSLWGLPAQRPVRVPYRDLLRDLNMRFLPGDVLLPVRAHEDNPVVSWQFRRYSLPEVLSSVVPDVEGALTSRRIWFTTADLFAPDVGNTFKGIERTHPQQDVIGRCDAAWCYLFILMEAPPLTQPVAFDDNMAFWGVDVDGVTRTAIRARLWWRVDKTPSQDYSIGLYLLDAGGALAAQADGPINNFGTETVSTTQLQPGAIYVDYRVLDLPPDLAPGDYRLALAIYRWTDGARLKLADDSDLLALNTITIR